MPKTLHKYLYVGGDPVNWLDPSGRDLVGEVSLTTKVVATVVLVSIVGEAIVGVLECIGEGVASAAGGPQVSSPPNSLGCYEMKHEPGEPEPPLPPLGPSRWPGPGEK